MYQKKVNELYQKANIKIQFTTTPLVNKILKFTLKNSIFINIFCYQTKELYVHFVHCLNNILITNKSSARILCVCVYFPLKTHLYLLGHKFFFHSTEICVLSVKIHLNKFNIYLHCNCILLTISFKVIMMNCYNIFSRTLMPSVSCFTSYFFDYFSNSIEE